jgi:hypothetical protein
MVIPQDTATNTQYHRSVSPDQRFECSRFLASEVALQELAVGQIGAQQSSPTEMPKYLGDCHVITFRGW